MVGSIVEFVDATLSGQSMNFAAEERVSGIDSVGVSMISGRPTDLRLSVALQMADGNTVEVEHRFPVITS
jgi:hypothetical protein